jgi:serine/tyrosine/threonine adenylyltransferase
MPPSPTFRPSIRHADLGNDFYDRVEAARFPEHRLRFRNQQWADRVGLGTLDDGEWIDHFGRFEPLPGSFPAPLALRYHGHQFRAYNPDIGDGRGFLFAQMHDTVDGRLLDLGTKGSGLTPYSRTADGRLTLKGGVREILATEMLEALGVNTSKTFSLIETGEALMRGDEPSPTRSSVLVRLSHSHIRIGSFQRLLFLEENDNIARLMDHTVETYLPEAQRDETGERAVAFLDAVSRRVAATGAAWMFAGFVHGVLNTDNINVTGESFDYGPWRFLPVLDPSFTAAYFDQTGLYAYGRQPDTLLWNLTRLAECLLPLADRSRLEAVLHTFEGIFREAFEAAALRRLGIGGGSQAQRGELVAALWTFLARSRAPFEQVLFDWHGGAGRRARAESGPAARHYSGPDYEAFAGALEAFEPAATHYAYFDRELPVTMLIEEVEALWEPIAEGDDWQPFEAKVSAIREMADAYGTAPRQPARA